MIKSSDLIKKMNDESEDIYADNILDYYSNRPKLLKNICLAVFGSMYDITGVGKSKKRNISGSEVEGSDEEINETQAPNCIPFNYKGKKLVLRKRKLGKNNKICKV